MNSHDGKSTCCAISSSERTDAVRVEAEEDEEEEPDDEDVPRAVPKRVLMEMFLPRRKNPCGLNSRNPPAAKGSRY